MKNTPLIFGLILLSFVPLVYILIDPRNKQIKYEYLYC